MDGKRRIRSLVLRASGLALPILPFISCIRSEEQADIVIRFSEAAPEVRSAPPQEQLISDISLMIFDESGSAEECIYLDNGVQECTCRLVADKRYTFCACANFGSQVYADHMEELQELVHYFAYPDEYREGIPMAATVEAAVTADAAIEIPLQRLMAKISLRVDRSRLDKDVEFNVRSARIGNCPRYVRPFGQSRIEDGDDAFPYGYFLDDIQTADLNTGIGDGLSREVSLYMFENIQGSADGPVIRDSDKIFREDDPRRDICSYIELDIDYLSSEKKSGEKGLIYRFYLGEDRSSFDVVRNTHYHITVTPENDGLSEMSWRVDQSGIEDIGPTWLKGYPSEYIQGNIGDRIHIWCEFNPRNAPFDVGIEYMEDDKAEGLYDYVIDEDGHGAVLTLTGPGRGLIYMEAGEPVNDAALFLIEINLPD